MDEAPKVWGQVPEHLRILADRINQLINGRSNAVGDVTLTANAASTTLTDARISVDSFIGLMPTTANAAGALATTYVSARGKGVATITHANNAQADKTFRYAIQG